MIEEETVEFRRKRQPCNSECFVKRVKKIAGINFRSTPADIHPKQDAVYCSEIQVYCEKLGVFL